MLGGGPRRDLRGCGVPGKGPPGGPGWPECLPLKRTLGKAAAHLHIEPPLALREHLLQEAGPDAPRGASPDPVTPATAPPHHPETLAHMAMPPRTP